MHAKCQNTQLERHTWRHLQIIRTDIQQQSYCKVTLPFKL